MTQKTSENKGAMHAQRTVKLQSKSKREIHITVKSGTKESSPQVVEEIEHLHGNLLPHGGVPQLQREQLIRNRGERNTAKEKRKKKDHCAIVLKRPNQRTTCTGGHGRKEQSCKNTN